jgi:dimethylargininase
VVCPTAFPRTAARLERAGVRIAVLDVSELAKAEGAVTCCSLILQD